MARRWLAALGLGLWLGSALAAPLLLDVRTPAEFADGHLPGAVSLPLDRLPADITRLAPDKNGLVRVYCHSGRRSALAAQQLQQLGYRQVQDLGGMAAAAQTLQQNP